MKMVLNVSSVYIIINYNNTDPIPDIRLGVYVFVGCFCTNNVLRK